MITLADVKEARERIGPLVHRTPLFGSATLSKMAGRPVYLKCENLQKTGSFKPRGALNNMMRLGPDERRRGVITISAGNHAQGVAWAASLLGIRAVVVMPAAASVTKAQAARGYGAEVILHGEISETFRRMEEIREERGLVFIHPFDDDATIAGQGTVGLEIFDDLPGVDTVVVGIGGGGLISGVALAIKESRPSVKVIGVEPTGAAVMHLSRRQGSPARLERADTIADGLAAPFAGARNFEIVEKYVDDLVLVEDSEIRSAMRTLLERCKVLAEPAGAAAAAALLSGKIPPGSGGTTAIVVSGGNVALDTLAALIRA
ncbi:MAG TPA: threonine/serine dehydratase [Candidatus Polarisedimenticolia bacterium]|jgi:threonine dehydratase